MNPYCHSRFKSIRRKTREVKVAQVGIGGDNPIRVQSMTTTATQDVEATSKQVIELAEAGCDLVRITAPNPAASRALKEISQKVRKAGIDVPLVADIHFLPSAAMEAVEHVEKVRVNPGNYADKKRFKTREYSDSEYEEELQRLHDSFSPLVIRAKELGRSLRIGTNHGSLSDRIMNRYGDTPLGMTESALEFIRIAESHGFKDIILSMKASNPKVMIEAYRLTVAKMLEEDMHYPLHLGVTEAGDGEDARIKSAIGIGSLLYDGLGDTIRVSLTEDPVLEVPVAKDLANIAEDLWQRESVKNTDEEFDELNPYEYNRRLTYPIILSKSCTLGTTQPPTVITPLEFDSNNPEKTFKALKATNSELSDVEVEGVLLKIDNEDILASLSETIAKLNNDCEFVALDVTSNINPEIISKSLTDIKSPVIICIKYRDHKESFHDWLAISAKSNELFLAIDLLPEDINEISTLLSENKKAIITCTASSKDMHPVGTYRKISDALKKCNLKAPIWIRCSKSNNLGSADHFSTQLLESSMFAGNLFCDGLGDMISIETDPDPQRSTGIAYNLLQGARMRSSKTEFVACPSCGRTLFDLQTTTQRIRSKTGHLKGVTIAVMGCIVNGPGEMADADFGYVGGSPGKINLYVGKTCVKTNIPEDEAVDRLIDLIREHDKWEEPLAVSQ